MGAEGFSSYESSVFIKFIESVGKWIAYAMIIFGLLALWAYSREKKEKEKQMTAVESTQQDNNLSYLIRLFA